jgi:hypothetical protein
MTTGLDPTNTLLKIVGTIIIMPYVIVMTLMTIAITLGPLMIAAALIVIGCLSLVIQWIKDRTTLLWLLFKWHISRWWWFKKKNF